MPPQGFDSMFVVKHIIASDVDTLGIVLPGHRRALLLAVQELNGGRLTITPLAAPAVPATDAPPAATAAAATATVAADAARPVVPARPSLPTAKPALAADVFAAPAAASQPEDEERLLNEVSERAAAPLDFAPLPNGAPAPAPAPVPKPRPAPRTVSVSESESAAPSSALSTPVEPAPAVTVAAAAEPPQSGPSQPARDRGSSVASGGYTSGHAGEHTSDDDDEDGDSDDDRASRAHARVGRQLPGARAVLPDAGNARARLRKVRRAMHFFFLG